jgi:CheY-like chemotaxis protein
VKTAANGAEALAMVDHHSFELIVLDLMMPVMSGWEFLEARGDDLVAQHVPVAVASAAHEPRSVLDCAAVCELLPKPFDLYELEAMIDRMLAPAPPPEELTA